MILENEWNIISKKKVTIQNKFIKNMEIDIKYIIDKKKNDYDFFILSINNIDFFTKYYTNKSIIDKVLKDKFILNEKEIQKIKDIMFKMKKK